MSALISLVLAAPWLGIVIEPQTEGRCVQIKAVMRGSPLQGVMKRGDCISAVDGSATASPEVLAAKIDSKGVGDVVVLKMVNDRRVSVKLTERPADAEARACQASSEVETQVSVHRRELLQRITLKPKATVAELRGAIGAKEPWVTAFHPFSCGEPSKVESSAGPGHVLTNGSTVWFDTSKPQTPEFETVETAEDDGGVTREVVRLLQR